MSLNGMLVLVVGPSGVGKDSIIAGLLEQASTSFPLLLAPRWCTRQQAGGIGHLPCSEAEFDLRLQLGCFALNWSANGHRYGIGCEIDLWLHAGAMVLINGSRSHAQHTLARYPQAGLLHITADPTVIAQRLHQRGREDEKAIEERLKRQPELPQHERQATIHNNGKLASAIVCGLEIMHQWRKKGCEM
ncbi:MAG: phosphonate metabolism protein/1,5-bisphosphokinase (PRPP-forming) PhnN [Planctomycetota bacterium]|nr:MAG: phosphonate metabolism protein/1,5-bisphosphokinase (PRPP-forming) PhnN [Planctomycetota bacterium]